METLPLSDLVGTRHTAPKFFNRFRYGENPQESRRPLGVFSFLTLLGRATRRFARRGVDFDSLDGEPVYIFFLLLAPQDSAGPHLKALARISRLIKDKYFRDMLRQAKDKKDVVRIIQTEDEKKI